MCSAALETEALGAEVSGARRYIHTMMPGVGENSGGSMAPRAVGRSTIVTPPRV
jgi:hypothetical protein